MDFFEQELRLLVHYSAATPDQRTIAHLIAAAHDRISDVVTPIKEDYDAASAILRAFGETRPRVGLETLGTFTGTFTDLIKRKLFDVMKAFPDVQITIIHDEIVFSGPDASAATGMYLDIKPHIPKYIRAILERRRHEFKQKRQTYYGRVWLKHYTEGIERIDKFLGTVEDLAIEFSTTATGKSSWRMKP